METVIAEVRQERTYMTCCVYSAERVVVSSTPTRRGTEDQNAELLCTLKTGIGKGDRKLAKRINQELARTRYTQRIRPENVFFI